MNSYRHKNFRIMDYCREIVYDDMISLHVLLVVYFKSTFHVFTTLRTTKLNLISEPTHQCYIRCRPTTYKCNIVSDGGRGRGERCWGGGDHFVWM